MPARADAFREGGCGAMDSHHAIGSLFHRKLFCESRNPTLGGGIG
jgi:hypothetical protein